MNIFKRSVCMWGRVIERTEIKIARVTVQDRTSRLMSGWFLGRLIPSAVVDECVVHGC